MAKRKNKKNCNIVNYVFLLLLVISVFVSTVGIHSAKVVDVAEYFVNMDEVVKSEEYKSMIEEQTKYYEEERAKGNESTLGTMFGIDNDVKIEDSFIPIYNYTEVKTINVYIKRLIAFIIISCILIVLTIYITLKNKKYIILFIIEIIGIIALFPISKSNVYPYCFIYLPILGFAYNIYNKKINTSK